MFIHCSRCDWEQDDFYHLPRFYKIEGKRRFTWGYSPLSRFIDTIKWLWKPRVLNMDGWIVGQGHKTIRIHSWKMFFLELKKIYRSWKNMKWYTLKSLKRDKDSYCPNCWNSGKGWWVSD